MGDGRCAVALVFSAEPIVLFSSWSLDSTDKLSVELLDFSVNDEFSAHSPGVEQTGREAQD